jgi:uncharacterized membrane protein YhaH (DUF805 family)
MKGNVIGFDPETNTGAISGHDGKRYNFATIDWHSHDHKPAHGDLVDFAPEGERATQIYLVEPEYVPPSVGAFYFSPRGRVSRSQYWLRYFLPVFVIGLILDAIAFSGGRRGLLALPYIFGIIVFWPGIALLIKRIHDRNKSGILVWALYGPLILGLLFIFLALSRLLGSRESVSELFIASGVVDVVVFVVAVWFFVEFGCMRGTIGTNRYGPDPVAS